jgi:hypothetical protein
MGSAPAATRHGERVAAQISAKPCLFDLLQFPGHEGDHPDAVRGNHGVQLPGNRAADERANPQFRQAKRLLDRLVVREDFLPLLDDALGLHLDGVNAPGGVEYRSDPVVPAGERRFHHPAPPSSFTGR